MFRFVLSNCSPPSPFVATTWFCPLRPPIKPDGPYGWSGAMLACWVMTLSKHVYLCTFAIYTYIIYIYISNIQNQISNIIYLSSRCWYSWYSNKSFFTPKPNCLEMFHTIPTCFWTAVTWGKRVVWSVTMSYSYRFPTKKNTVVSKIPWTDIQNRHINSYCSFVGINLWI